MFRKDLIDILRGHPISLHDLVVMQEEKPKDLEDDLHHLFRSLRSEPLSPVIIPATCNKCGFVFHKDKLHKPGKCPICKGNWITDPLISLEEKR